MKLYCGIDLHSSNSVSAVLASLPAGNANMIASLQGLPVRRIASVVFFDRFPAYPYLIDCARLN